MFAFISDFKSYLKCKYIIINMSIISIWTYIFYIISYFILLFEITIITWNYHLEIIPFLNKILKLTRIYSSFETYLLDIFMNYFFHKLFIILISNKKWLIVIVYFFTFYYTKSLLTFLHYSYTAISIYF